MTKAKFFRFCDTSDVEPYVDWRCKYREIDRAVFLSGSWHSCAIVDVNLYCPTPGRQWEVDQFKSADASCERMAKKFQRWLDEWRQTPKGKANMALYAEISEIERKMRNP